MFLMVESYIVGGRPKPKLWGKYKKPHPRFNRFFYENPLKIDFFPQIHDKSICYFYILLFDSFIVSLWFWTETAETNLEQNSNF